MSRFRLQPNIIRRPRVDSEIRTWRLDFTYREFWIRGSERNNPWGYKTAKMPPRRTPTIIATAIRDPRSELLCLVKSPSLRPAMAVSKQRRIEDVEKVTFYSITVGLFMERNGKLKPDKIKIYFSGTKHESWSSQRRWARNNPMFRGTTYSLWMVRTKSKD